MAEVDPSTVKEFMELFAGRTDAWGSVEGKANKETVTQKHYECHLRGEVSLGVYMMMDDATCHFFAIDIDDKDIDKALKIRQTFAEFNINTYLAFSKSKGYHCYCFADNHFKAYDIRRLCHAVLAKLDIQAEVFPKQDELDEQIPLGNYINLPCFGNSRMFFTASKTAVSMVDAVKRIRRVTQQTIEEALKNLPPLPKAVFLHEKKKGRPKKSKSSNAPCIDNVLKGVSHPGRDEAAFALARYHLDRGYTQEEVFQVLQQWDTKNKPPLNDLHLLLTKVRSAAKGYAFGCSSIQGNPYLASFCVREENCPWIKALNEEKKKKGLIREQVFHETETHLYEEIVRDQKILFAAYEKATGEVTYVKGIEYPDFTIMPVGGAELTEGVVYFPSEVMKYGDTVNLKNEIRDFVYTYVDLDSQDIEYCAWYIMGTWVYDKLDTVAYLRFLGDTGVGKSRALDVVAKLCFRALMLAGAVTPAPIYREIRRFRGTVILDEADFRESDEKSEVITILNCGISRDRAVLRCSGDDRNIIEVLPTFGPKAFATRKEFEDKALESRCYTCKMRQTAREDIIYELKIDPNFAKRSMELRNKLLLWRFHNYGHITENIPNVDMGHIEPRLKQMGLPLAVPFMHLPEVMDDFRRFLQERQKEIIQQREETKEGEVVRAIFELVQRNGKWISAGKVVAQLFGEISQEEVKAERNRIASIMRTRLGIKTSRKKTRAPGESVQHYHIIWDEALMKTLLERYILEPEEFTDIFEIDMEV